MNTRILKVRKWIMIYNDYRFSKPFKVPDIPKTLKLDEKGIYYNKKNKKCKNVLCHELQEITFLTTADWLIPIYCWDSSNILDRGNFLSLFL